MTAVAIPLAAADSPIDPGVLSRLLSNDQSAIQAVLRQFLDCCPQDASALAAAVSAADTQAALRCAHRLKGSCRMVGAEPLAGVCERIEDAVRAGDRRTSAAVANLDYEAARLTDYLRDRLNEPS